MRLKHLLLALVSPGLAMAACAKVNSESRSMSGAFTSVSVADADVRTAADFAIDAEQRALQAVSKPATLELAGILDAEQQVVAGINYRLNLRVRRDGQEQDAEALVWWQAWRKPDPYRLTSWQWR